MISSRWSSEQKHMLKLSTNNDNHKTIYLVTQITWSLPNLPEKNNNKKKSWRFKSPSEEYSNSQSGFLSILRTQWWLPENTAFGVRA